MGGPQEEEEEKLQYLSTALQHREILCLNKKLGLEHRVGYATAFLDQKGLRALLKIGSLAVLVQQPRALTVKSQLSIK